ncbi:cytochrome b/b6 domain-containing protein [Streptomyces sp. NPDC052225]|uniref:cytochrome b/b6 domain-containing protein n=1 Tax=Streptomyces sp. NPDC052225 TaxID=3154949 RepID=UPI0034371556
MRSTDGSTGPTGTATRPDPDGRVRRFGPAERRVHRATGCLMLVCVVSAACLYLGPLAQLVGRRALLVTVHEWSGILLPAPFLLGLRSAAFRADLRRLNRRPAKKFNTGQKIYAGWIAGAVPVMMFTGLLMWFMGLAPFISRTSAIFVHDLLAWAVVFVILGHVRKALADPEARLGMRTGHVSRSWARRQHPGWLREEDEETGRTVE